VLALSAVKARTGMQLIITMEHKQSLIDVPCGLSHVFSVLRRSCVCFRVPAGPSAPHALSITLPKFTVMSD
jgi:hypothetical protein